MHGQQNIEKKILKKCLPGNVNPVV